MLVDLLLVEQSVRNFTGSVLDLASNALSGRRSLLRQVGCDLALGGGRIDTVAAVLLDELSQVLNSASTLVGNWRVLLAGWVELDGGEALNLIRDIIEVSINLGDGNLVGEGLEELSQLVVLGCQTVQLVSFLHSEIGMRDTYALQ